MSGAASRSGLTTRSTGGRPAIPSSGPCRSQSARSPGATRATTICFEVGRMTVVLALLVAAVQVPLSPELREWRTDFSRHTVPLAEIVSGGPPKDGIPAFDRRVDGRVLDFGTTGRLRHSDLVMYDRQTESWWQQATGEGIVGTYAGKELRLIAAPVTSWRDFREAYPTGRVL